MNIKTLISTQNTNFDEQIYNSATLIGTVFGLTTVLINQLNDYPIIFDIAVSLTPISFTVLYYLSRFKKLTSKLKIPFLLVLTLSNTNAWFYNEGLFGSTTYLFVFSCVGLPFIFRTARFYVLSFVILNTIILILIGYFFPESILPYPNYESRFIDIAVVLIVILIVTSFTLNLFTKTLDKEKQIIENQNKKLEQQKEEITAQADELKKINNKLVELDRYKELMIGMVIHDLKNPLNSIIGLSNQTCSERNMLIIKQSGKQMLNLVMNILDVQKFDNTELRLNCESANIHDVIVQSLTDISGLIDEKNIDIQLSGQFSYSVFIDNTLVMRVFTNILSNAIKYSDNNSKILIHCEAFQNEVKISITDFGTGIQHDKISQVFDRFVQIDSRKSGALRSTGLGLAFCKMVINAHNCEIGVNSESGVSTTFWFTLPRCQQESGVVIDENFDLLKKHQILLTNNDLAFLKPILEQLRQMKYYESGKIITLLNSIDDKTSESIVQWKVEMENAVLANNEMKFNELIGLIMR